MSTVSARSEWSARAAPPEFQRRHAPRIDVEPVAACPVCQHDRFHAYAVGFDYELLTCSNPWRFVECDRCAHVWLHPRPAVHTLPVIYPPTYYAYNYATQINPIAVRGKRLLDALKMRAILAQLPSRPRSFLDVGCGDGRFLRVMADTGIPRSRIYGLELDERVIRNLSAEGFRAYRERVETCDALPPNSIDLATMFHVIEHVSDPAAVVAKIASVLSPGGVFAVETPNVQSLDARLFKATYWGGYHIPRHWNLFRPSTLAALLEQNGLEVIATQYQTGHSFWMYSFHHVLRYNRRRPAPGLARWFDPTTGLPFLIACTAWDKLRATLGFRTSAMLLLARKPAA